MVEACGVGEACGGGVGEACAPPSEFRSPKNHMGLYKSVHYLLRHRLEFVAPVIVVIFPAGHE